MRALTSPQFLINQPPEKADSIATALFGEFQDANLSHEWEELAVQVLTLTQVQKATNTSAVCDFCDQIAKMTGGIEAVMVEELDGGAQHVTTFLSDRSAELEAQIYKVEAEIIKKYPGVILDFNVRVVPKDANGSPELPYGPYYLLTWRAA